MNQAIRADLENILRRLAEEWQHAIGVPVKYTATPEGAEHRFMVPDALGKKRIGGGRCYVRRSLSHGKDRPCAIVGVDASLLNDTNHAYVGRYKERAHWGQSSRGEVHIAVCRIGDSDFQLALTALVEAARNLLSGTRYNW